MYIIVYHKAWDLLARAPTLSVFTYRNSVAVNTRRLPQTEERVSNWDHVFVVIDMYSPPSPPRWDSLSATDMRNLNFRVVPQVLL